MDTTFYLDTSAVFKQYVHEKGSNFINRLIDSKSLIYLSQLSLIETILNLRRLADVNQIITASEFHMLEKAFLKDAGNRYRILDVTPTVLLYSLTVCSREYITPIDAIQLATALSLREPPVFVCSDQKLLEKARKYHLTTLNPAEEN